MGLNTMHRSILPSARHPRSASSAHTRLGPLAVLLMLCGSPTLLGQPAPTSVAVEPATEPPASRAENLPDDINASFLDPNMDPEDFIKRFEVESREVFVGRQQIIDALQLAPGMAVADIGAGTGLFLRLLSKSVGPEGKVYAVEIAPNFIQLLRQRARDEGLENVQVVFCSDRHAHLPPDSVDRILICDVYHHFEYPQATLASLHSALRAGGQLIVVDFHRQPPGVSPERLEWLQGHIRAPQETFRREIEQAGFRFEEEVAIDGFVENYLLRFSKP